SSDVAKLTSLLAPRPWTDAFLPENVRAHYWLARYLSALAFLDGAVRGGLARFDLVPAPETYDQLPPRRQPLELVVVFDVPLAPATKAAPAAEKPGLTIPPR